MVAIHGASAWIHQCLRCVVVVDGILFCGAARVHTDLLATLCCQSSPQRHLFADRVHVRTTCSLPGGGANGNIAVTGSCSISTFRKRTSISGWGGTDFSVCEAALAISVVDRFILVDFHETQVS